MHCRTEYRIIYIVKQRFQFFGDTDAESNRIRIGLDFIFVFEEVIKWITSEKLSWSLFFVMYFSPTSSEDVKNETVTV